MAKRKKQYPLSFKGKKINNFFKAEVIKTARAIKADVSTPYKLKKFFDRNKNLFEGLFSEGTETVGVGTSNIYNQIDKAEKNGHEFYFKENEIELDATPLDIKFHIAKVEQLCNSILGSTGFEYSFKRTYDGKEIFELPTEDEIEMLSTESVEFAVDYLSNYGIKLYTSDKKNKNYKENENRRKLYDKRTTEKFNKFRQQYNKAKTGKTKTTRKKRK